MTYRTRSALGATPLQYRGDLNANANNGFPVGQPIYLVHPLQTFNSDSEATAALATLLGRPGGNAATLSLIGTGTAANIKAQPFLQFDGAMHNAGIVLSINGTPTTLWLTQYGTLTDGVTEYAAAEVEALLPPLLPPPPPPPTILPPPPVVVQPPIVIGEGPPPPPGISVKPGPTGIDIYAPVTPTAVAPLVDSEVATTAPAAAATSSIPMWGWIAGGLAVLALLGRKRS